MFYFTKKISVIIGIFCLLAFGSFAQGIFEFTETEHDFGEIEEGVKASHTFEFTNVGDEPIVISKAQPSCGCTVPDWSKEPVPPQESSSIKVVFNSSRRPGNFYKTITITSNASEATKSLRIKGKVIPKEDGENTSGE